MSMGRTANTALVLLIGALLIGASGCGYRQMGAYDGKADSGYKWHSLYREDYHTIAVPIFKNQDYTRGVEFSLTSALVKELQLRTPYKVVDREKAQTILEGEIESVRTITLSRDINTGQPQEQLVTCTVNFIWKDLKTGRILVQRKGFDQSTTYYATLGEGYSLATEDAAEKLAVGIVEELQADW